MEWREEVALCVSAGGGDVERAMRRDGDDGPLVGVAGQRAGEGLHFLVVCGDRDGRPRRGGSGSSQRQSGGQRQRPEHHLPAVQSKVHAFVLSLRLLALFYVQRTINEEVSRRHGTRVPFWSGNLARASPYTE